MNLRREYDFRKLNDYAAAQALAVEVAAKYPDKVFLAYDYGRGISPRYGVIDAPVVGEDVSHTINGDYYPVGKVEAVGKNYRMIKAGGVWYYRRKLAPTWKDGCMTLIKGIHDKLNPHV